MSTLALTVAAILHLLPMAEGAEGGSGLGQAIAIGLGALAALMGLLIATVAFGGGRDHS